MIIRMLPLALLGCASRPPLQCATTVPVDVITVCVSDDLLPGGGSEEPGVSLPPMRPLPNGGSN